MSVVSFVFFPFLNFYDFVKFVRYKYVYVNVAVPGTWISDGGSTSQKDSSYRSEVVCKLTNSYSLFCFLNFLLPTIYVLQYSWLYFSCSPNHLTLVVVNNVPLFFCIRDGPYMPTLRLLHQCNITFPSHHPCYMVLLSKHNISGCFIHTITLLHTC